MAGCCQPRIERCPNEKPAFFVRKCAKIHLQQSRISKISRGLYPRTPASACNMLTVQLDSVVKVIERNPSLLPSPARRSHSSLAYTNMSRLPRERGSVRLVAVLSPWSLKPLHLISVASRQSCQRIIMYFKKFGYNLMTKT